MVSAERELKRPNILIILSDQHRFDCLGARGNSDIKTPNLDALAQDGVRYENCFCPFPVCTPSRYSLLSGVYAYQHRGLDNRSTPLPAIEMFPRILRDAGYKTKALGKMHFTPTYLDVGFDEMELCEQDGPGRWDDDYHRELRALGLADLHDLEDQRQEYRQNAPREYWETFGAMPSNLAEEHHSTTWIGNRAVDAISTWEGGGNCLMAGFVKPHHPFDPPRPWCDLYDPAALALLPGWTEQCLERDVMFSRGYFDNTALNEPALRRVMAHYYATVTQMDRHAGRMIDALKASGQYDDTLIVYTSDHGDFMGFHHLILKANHPYDPLVKVPLIIKYPGNPADGVSTTLVSNLDLAPTILRLAGCEPHPQMEGLDLTSDFGGRDVVFNESRGPGGLHLMARTATYKLILANSPDFNLFFDLDNDPLEMENLFGSGAHQDMIDQLTAAIAEWRRGPDGAQDREIKPAYVDHNAPQIDQPNVPPADMSHRPEIITYYEKTVARMKAGG